MTIRHPQRFMGFDRLVSPDDYRKVFAETAGSDITVVKWASDGCRTCRAATPKIRALMGKWGYQAHFFSMDLVQGDRTMLEFFKARNVTQLPFIELYVGTELIETLVVPPSRVAFLRVALGTAAERWRLRRSRQEQRRLLLALRDTRREQRLLARRRVALSRRWRRYHLMVRLVSGTEPNRAQRRKHLLAVLALLREREEHGRFARRLERRWHLFKLIVTRQRTSASGALGRTAHARAAP